MKEFTRGDAIWIRTTFTDQNSLHFDPSSTWGFVYDSSSTLVGSMSSMTRVETGVYDTVWQSTSSAGLGVVAFEAHGTAGSYEYVKREILFKLI